MSTNTIVIGSGQLIMVANGLQLRDLPATGNVLEIARGQAPATYVPSFGRAAAIIGPAWWQVSVTLEAAGESDNWLEQSLKAFLAGKGLWSFSAERGGVVLISSVAMVPTDVPPITYASDGFPMRTWVISGKCSFEPTAGIYTAAPTLTAEDVQNA